MDEPSPTPVPAVRVSINSDTSEVWVYENETMAEKISIKETFEKLEKAHSASQYYLAPNSLDFNLEGQKYSLKFLPTQLEIRPSDRTDTKGMSSYRNAGYVLIKRK